jgi:glycosyltransferase involved in cell wall biosynthesis
MPIKVALIANELSVLGGIHTLTTFLYRVLSDSGMYQPDVISLATSVSDRTSVHFRNPKTWISGPTSIKIEDKGLSYTHVGAIGSEIEIQRYKPRPILNKLLQEYDILQFIVGSPPWACVASGINRPVLIWTATTTRGDRESRIKASSLMRKAWSSLMLPLVDRYELRALRSADCVFALSKYTFENVQKFVKPGRTVIAPCGVDTDLFHPSSQYSPDNYILCVARLSDPRKNVTLLLEAYAILKRNLGSVPDLYLVGDLPTEKNIELLRELGIAENVRLLGNTSANQLPDLYRKALLFVLPSNEEGLGIVILEAMASGVPVVSTACGGPATMIVDGETGFLTPVGDAQAMAAAMQSLITDPSLCKRMGEVGRRVCEEHFSIPAVGKIFLDKYGEIIKDSSRNYSSERLQDKPSVNSLQKEFS